MLFDRFAQVVGAGMPSLRTPMAKARVFHIDASAKEVLPTELDYDQQDFMRNLFLPFQYTYIEDRGSGTLIWDPVEGQAGACCERVFADCVILDDKDTYSWLRDSERSERPMYKELARENPGAGVIVIGHIRNIPIITSKNYEVEVALEGICVFDPGTKVVYTERKDLSGEIIEVALSGAGTNAKTALEWIVYMNDKSRFVLESTPTHREKKPKKIRSSSDRPIYTVLRPAEIRKVMKLEAPKEDGSGKRPHERRAHLRYYRSERYSEKRREKPQTIKSTWVGPKEATVGNRHYKVLVDM